MSWLAGLVWAGLYKEWMDFVKNCLEGGEYAREEPITFWCELDEGEIC